MEKKPIRTTSKGLFIILFGLPLFMVSLLSAIIMTANQILYIDGILLTIIVIVLPVLGYFIYKLVFWNSFSVGVAPLVIGLFFFSAVQLFFIGIIGEYIGSIHTQVMRMR